jgi:hypothetical protein
MSKTNEYKLFQLLKNNLKNTHFTRIESHTELGIPDVNACHNGQEVWLELKANSRKDLGLSKYQVVWMKKRIKHGGNVWIMNRPLLQRALKIYSGSIVREPITSDTEPLATFNEPIDWIALKDLLFTAGEPRTSDKSRPTSA